MIFTVFSSCKNPMILIKPAIGHWECTLFPSPLMRWVYSPVGSTGSQSLGSCLNFPYSHLCELSQPISLNLSHFPRVHKVWSGLSFPREKTHGTKPKLSRAGLAVLVPAEETHKYVKPSQINTGLSYLKSDLRVASNCNPLGLEWSINTQKI